MNRNVAIFSCVCLLLLSVGHGRTAKAAPRELVMANEAFAGAGQYLAQNVEAFVRRVEQVVGWPKGSLKGKAFVKPAEALPYIRENKVAFAILPVHQFVQARQELKLQPLGRAVGFDGTGPAFWGVSRKDSIPSPGVEEKPGLRLAMTEIEDLQWINVLFEAHVRPERHFRLMGMESPKAALDAVLAKKADFALLYETDFRAVKDRVSETGDLAWVYTSGGIPPFPVLAVGKYASKADQKKLAGGLTKICKEQGADACGRVNILYIEAGRADSYQAIITKYETYR